MAIQTRKWCDSVGRGVARTPTSLQTKLDASMWIILLMMRLETRPRDTVVLTFLSPHITSTCQRLILPTSYRLHFGRNMVYPFPQRIQLVPHLVVVSDGFPITSKGLIVPVLVELFRCARRRKFEE